MVNSLVWIGVRESDITDIEDVFQQSITIFGSGENGNISMERSLSKRFNHNEAMPKYDDFFATAMREVLNLRPESRFVQYDAADSASFDCKLRDKIIYKNEYELLNFINNKITSKIWATNYVDVLPYRLFEWKNVESDTLKKTFPNSKRVVVQRSFSCGGKGTYLVSPEFSSCLSLPIESNEEVIVTEYQERNVPVNLHAVIYKNETFLFPPSIQLISLEHDCLEYVGSDFTAFHDLPKKEQNLVFELGMKICDALRKKGYLGVCGIDSILVNGSCFFMEVNGRFQASTALLNKHLAKNGFKCIQEYHIDAFLNKKPSFPCPLKSADGSLINFYYTAEECERLKWLHQKLGQASDFDLCDDSLDWNCPIEDGSYLFQIRCVGPISSVTYQNTVRLHPNARISSFSLDSSNCFSNLIKLKALLLSRGISITPVVWALLQNLGGADWEEFGALTLNLFECIWITAPCLESWYMLSPLELDYDYQSERFILCYYSKRLFPIDILKTDPYGNKQTRNNHYIKDIVYLSADRLRVYYRNGCALQEIGEGCKFCDLYGTDKPFDFEEICEALSYYWENDSVKHYLIGGGSEISSEQYKMILDIARLIHANNDKHIYLMSQPITDFEILKELRKNGITEVAFNIEMFDRDIAKAVMPGKSRNTLIDYYNSFEQAVKVWGSTGNVRSVILLGFDDVQTFAKGIRELCERGVSPILSLFRPCPNTPLKHFMPPNEDETLLYYETAKTICNKYGLNLGPSCKACQNNTVALDM